MECVFSKILRVLILFALLSSMDAHAGKLKKVKLKWALIENAASYQLELKNGNGAVLPISVEQKGKKNPEVIKEMETGLYAFRIRAVDRIDRPGVWSPWAPLVISAEEVEPELPQENKIYKNSQSPVDVEFKWSGVKQAHSYRLVLKREGKDFESRVTLETGLKMNALIAGRYSWQVIPLFKAGAKFPLKGKNLWDGTPSEEFKFEILSDFDRDLAAADMTLEDQMDWMEKKDVFFIGSSVAPSTTSFADASEEGREDFSRDYSQSSLFVRYMHKVNSYWTVELGAKVNLLDKDPDVVVDTPDKVKLFDIDVTFLRRFYIQNSSTGFYLGMGFTGRMRDEQALQKSGDGTTYNSLYAQIPMVGPEFSLWVGRNFKLKHHFKIGATFFTPFMSLSDDEMKLSEPALYVNSLKLSANYEWRMTPRFSLISALGFETSGRNLELSDSSSLLANSSTKFYVYRQVEFKSTYLILGLTAGF